MIDDDQRTFFESGIAVLIGTRDARLFPECVRAAGARVEPGGREVTVFLPVATGACTLANLRDNGRIAVCFSRAFDHRSIQVKGRVLEVRAASEVDRGAVDRYRAALAEAWNWVGVPTQITLRMNQWPCHAVRFRVEGVYSQTPGPGAGDVIAEPEKEAPA